MRRSEETPGASGWRWQRRWPRQNQEGRSWGICDEARPCQGTRRLASTKAERVHTSKGKSGMLKPGRLLKVLAPGGGFTFFPHPSGGILAKITVPGRAVTSSAAPAAGRSWVKPKPVRGWGFPSAQPPPVTPAAARVGVPLRGLCSEGFLPPKRGEEEPNWDLLLHGAAASSREEAPGCWVRGLGVCARAVVLGSWLWALPLTGQAALGAGRSLRRLPPPPSVP